MNAIVFLIDTLQSCRAFPCRCLPYLPQPRQSILQCQKPDLACPEPKTFRAKRSFPVLRREGFRYAISNGNSHLRVLDIGCVRRSLDKKDLQSYRKGQQHSLASIPGPVENR